MSKFDGLFADKRCLVLDDEFMIALDIQQILEGAGAREVVCLPDSAAAVAALQDGSAFDFAVLDVKLSSATTSLSVAALLAEKNIPFIFLTGMRRDDVHRAQFPSAPLVEKPYLVSLLMEAAAQALSRGTSGG